MCLRTKPTEILDTHIHTNTYTFYTQQHAFPLQLPATAVTRCPPHLLIPRLMEKPQRLYTAAAANRGTLKLAVALIPSKGLIYMQGLTSTTCSQFMPSKKFTTKTGQTASSFTSMEYMDFLKHVLSRAGRRQRVVLVHDREPCHLSAEVGELMREHGHTIMTLPPRSPDLDPLDYAVFGTAKRWLARNWPAGQHDFSARCDAFHSHIASMDPGVLIRGYQLRLRKVLQQKGGHIEGAILRGS